MIDNFIHLAPAISAVAAIAAFLVSWANRRRIQSVHVDINSRLTQLIEATRAAAHAEGLAEGHAESAAHAEGES